MLADDHALKSAAPLDDARLHPRHADARHSPEDRAAGHAELQQVVGSLDAVEKGKDGRTILGGLSDDRSDRIERITLDAEDREVGRGEIIGAVGGRDLYYCRSLRRSDLQATTADRGQILSARVERDIVSCARQLPAVIGADRAGAEHYDFQGLVLGFSARTNAERFRIRNQMTTAPRIAEKASITFVTMP